MSDVSTGKWRGTTNDVTVRRVGMIQGTVSDVSTCIFCVPSKRAFGDYVRYIKKNPLSLSLLDKFNNTRDNNKPPSTPQPETRHTPLPQWLSNPTNSRHHNVRELLPRWWRRSPMRCNLKRQWCNSYRTPCLGLVGTRFTRHTRGVAVYVRIVPDWARLAFLGARVGPLSRGTFCGVSNT